MWRSPCRCSGAMRRPARLESSDPTAGGAMDWVESLTLGVVQGLTEFLPISSDGHLAIAIQAFDRLRGRHSSGAEILFFVVMLHLGTLAAIVVYYRAAAGAGVRGLLGSEEVPPAFRRRSVLRAGLLAAIATAPAVPVGLLFKTALEGLF